MTGDWDLRRLCPCDGVVRFEFSIFVAGIILLSTVLKSYRNGSRQFAITAVLLTLSYSDLVWWMVFWQGDCVFFGVVRRADRLRHRKKQMDFSAEHGK
jgi:hypothetical protein